MGRTDRASRLLPAGPEEVYAALVDPAAIARWLPPVGMTGSVQEWEARPGGSFRMTLTYETSGGGKTTGDSDVTEGVFVDLVPGERFVQDVVFDSADPAFAGTMRMTWTLRPTGAGTLVEITASDVPTGITARDHAAGLASSLQNLDQFLRR